MSKRILGGVAAGIVAAGIVAALAACDRAADAPAESSAPPPASAPGQEPQAVSPPKSIAGTSSAGTSSAGMPAPTAPKTEPAPEADEDASSAVAGEREDRQRIGPVPAGGEQRQPEDAPREAGLAQPVGAEAPATTQAGDAPPTPIAGIPSEEDPSAERGTEPERPRPAPLVEDPSRLKPLDPKDPVWIDPVSKEVVMLAEVCQRQAPLELFACLRGSKEHESVLVVDAKAYVVHAGLLVAGAEPGSPVRFDPDFAPPRGTEIEVTVVWKDEQGRRRRARGQDWVQDVAQTYAALEGVVPNRFDEELSPGNQWAAWKAMELPWVFAGSQFLEDERTGKRDYYADLDGCLICVSNFPSAVLDVPVQSTDSNAALWFTAFTERIPPLGTPVTLILTPKRDAPAESAPPKGP